MRLTESARAFFPLTSVPNDCAGYAEYAPCAALAPYVRCFWTARGERRLVNPDVCADIMFTARGVFFSGVSGEPFTGGEDGCAFGIRFYAWSAWLFADDALRGTQDGCFEAAAHFGSAARGLFPLISEAGSVTERIAAAERWLLGRLYGGVCGGETLMRAAGLIAERRGVITVGELSRELFICQRALERVFAEYAGISPKRLAALVRYQSVWRDLVTLPRVSLAGLAAEYGYADQAHLTRDFTRRHSMPPLAALAYARRAQQGAGERREAL